MRVPVPEVIPPAEALGRVHLVGIGGAGLSAIARVLLARGIPVSGSDAAESATLASLRALGATVHVGHTAGQVAEADTLVVSTAVRADNPEVLEAQQRGLTVLPRSAAMASIMRGHRVVAVAGTHGKTTTTSLLTSALLAAGADPTYTIGGDLSASGSNAAQGGDLFVAEADESDGAFLVYTPYAGVVTNVEPDHLDQWETEEAYYQAFTEFVLRIDPGGFLVLCADDPGAAGLIEVARGSGLRVLTTGLSSGLDLRAADVQLAGSTSSFDVIRTGSPGEGDTLLGRVRLQIPGQHYVLDALLALGAGLELGHPFDALVSGLESFTGTRRRMERKGEARGVSVYDSYAHHPKEITGDLQAARALAGDGRVLVIFQPHMVSHTRLFGAGMGQALGAADEVVVLDVYLAREDPEPGIDGALVASHVPLPPAQVRHVRDADEVPALMAALARPGDVVLTLGAGDVTHLAPRVLTELDSAGGV